MTRLLLCRIQNPITPVCRGLLAGSALGDIQIGALEKIHDFLAAIGISRYSETRERGTVVLLLRAPMPFHIFPYIIPLLVKRPFFHIRWTVFHRHSIGKEGAGY